MAMIEEFLDWSFDLLSEEEQALLRRLSVFAGGWPLEAAEAVGADEGAEAWEVLGRLTRLVDKSLVEVWETRGELRYRLLETVREYSRDGLRERGMPMQSGDAITRGYWGLPSERSPIYSGRIKARGSIGWRRSTTTCARRWTGAVRAMRGHGPSFDWRE